MLQVSRRVEYALRAVLYLAKQPDGRPCSFREIAEAEAAPATFLAKIMRALSEAGVVTSVRGAGGGYCLAIPAADLSFYEVMVAADGPIALNLCTDNGDGCSQTAHCSMSQVWRRGEDAMIEVFRATRIADLISHPVVLSLDQLERQATPCSAV